MKKLAMILSVLLIVVSFSACGVNPSSKAATLEIDSAKEAIASSEYEKNLDGMIDYMKDNQLIAGDSVEMSFDFIGAIAGQKFSYKSSGTTATCELYEFDTENVSETAQTVIDSVKENGYFMSLHNEVNAKITANDQFLMVLATTSVDDEGKLLIEKTEKMFSEFE